MFANCSVWNHTPVEIHMLKDISFYYHYLHLALPPGSNSVISEISLMASQHLI